MRARVLYIEDEPLLGKLFAAAMTAHDYDVTVCGTGTDGLARLADEPFDILAIDYQLPDMSGIDVARRALTTHPDIPLLMVTGQGDERLAVEAMTLGIANYVAKDDSNVYLELIPSIVTHLLDRAQDIKSRRVAERAKSESDQRFHALMASTPAAIHEMDFDGMLKTLNPAGQRLFGLNTDLVEPIRLTDIASADDRPFVSAALAQAAEGQEATVDFTANHGGDIWTLSMTVAPVRNDAAEIVALVGVTVDVTQRHAADMARDEALAEAVRANQAKSDFLAAMSHEFRTPLNAIMGFSDVLRTETYGEIGHHKYKEYATHIFDSGEHMLSLVNELLDISTIEAGKRELNRSPVPIAPLLRDCVRRFERTAKERGIQLAADLPDDLLLLRVDRRALIQIVQNLLSNSMKYTFADGTVNLAVAVTENAVDIIVSDSGTGIPADKLPSITDPFTRVVADPYVTQSGTGLGLSIVRSLVEAHAGQLNIQSDFGFGTEVTVTLPR